MFIEMRFSLVRESFIVFSEKLHLGVKYLTNGLNRKIWVAERAVGNLEMILQNITLSYGLISIFRGYVLKWKNYEGLTFASQCLDEINIYLEKRKVPRVLIFFN